MRVNSSPRKVQRQRHLRGSEKRDHLPLRISLRPFPCLFLVRLAIALVEIRDFRRQRVVRIGVREETQNTQERLGNRECRAPPVFQNIKADATSCVDIRMVDFGAERHNRRLERIVTRKRDGQLEHTPLKWRIRGTEDHGLPTKEILFVDRAGCTIRRRILLNLLELVL